MKILHLSTAAGGSGAGIAALRIHRSLLEAKVDSQLLVRDNYVSNEEPGLLQISNPMGSLGKKLLPHFDKLLNRQYPQKDPALFSPAWIKSPKLLKMINKIKPDLINLHWVNFGLIKIEQLKKIDLPLVWTMHDNWLFTGGCHIMWDCKKYMQKCGNCPRLNSNKEKDLSRKVWLRKHKSFSQIERLHPIAPSQWLKDRADQSSLLKKRNTKVIPNPLDCKLFKPVDNTKAREHWGLSADKKIILFGALAATSDLNKGFDLLDSALKKLDLRDTEIVIFGSDGSDQNLDYNCPIRFLGSLKHEDQLAKLYSAADVMVVPSRQEAFGQTATEAMACGTPVVAFDQTGIADIVDHMENGYLAEAADPNDLAKGIEFVLNSNNELAEPARIKVETNFEAPRVGKTYQELYRQILLRDG